MTDKQRDFLMTLGARQVSRNMHARSFKLENRALVCLMRDANIYSPEKTVAEIWTEVSGSVPCESFEDAIERMMAREKL